MMIGETVEAESEISDEEIASWLDTKSNDIDLAAVAILRSLAAKYAKRATITTGNEKLELGKVSENYIALAKEIESSEGQNKTLSNTRVRRRVGDRVNTRNPYNRDTYF